jgi:hypothetical protein
LDLAYILGEAKAAEADARLRRMNRAAHLFMKAAMHSWRDHKTFPATASCGFAEAFSRIITSD